MKKKIPFNSMQSLLKHLFSLVFIVVSHYAFSQNAPQLINYQGVARYANGTAIAGKPLGIQFTILQGSASGTPVFTETQNVTSNNAGIFAAQIGKINSLGTVNWQGSSYYLKVDIDTTGGSNYISSGSAQQLVSVPYALYAASAPSPSLAYSSNVLSVGNSTVSIPAQSLSVSGNTLSVSGGTSVVLPDVTGLGATTVNTTTTGYSVFTPSVTISALPVPIYGSGLLTIGGTYPNYSLAAIPTGTYISSTGSLTIWNPLASGGPSLGIYIAPTPSLVGNNLSIGPLTNVVNLDPIAPWRHNTAANTVTMSTPSDNVGIGTIIGNTPSAKLHVDGFTKLGDAAPPIKTHTLGGFAAGSQGATTPVSFSGTLTADKIISVSVMVEMTLNGNDWIPAGYTSSPGYEFNWKVNSASNTVDVINSAANSTNLAGRRIRIMLVYVP